jgi:lipopolysaccharide biosynthesis regulator YciM
MALTLAGYHKPEESGRIFDVIDTSNTTLTDFAAFHVLSAWDAVYRGDISQASSKLQKAFDMAPRHVAANWLKALIAKRQEDTRRGVEALEVLFAADPYNKNYRNMIRHFRSKLKTPELEQLYKEVLEREKG